MTKDGSRADDLPQIGILDGRPVSGRFAAETEAKVIGAGARYPAASGPWNDPVATSLNSAPDRVCDDAGSDPAYWQAPVAGTAAEIERASQVLEDQANAPNPFDGLSDAEGASPCFPKTSPSRFSATNGHDEVLVRAANLHIGRAADETAVRLFPKDAIHYRNGAQIIASKDGEKGWSQSSIADAPWHGTCLKSLARPPRARPRPYLQCP
jgi:hypothetical protein